ncbi:MAG TPA: TAXI family TRAP transporter solute-binding subunit [Bradyrhizobium sp.]|nr:TAXI family TRAP transporter solute-binding subunit [Bradyrhizobium sp.]
MWRRSWKPLVIVLSSAAIVLAVLFIAYRWIDPLPPRHFVIAAGAAGSGYDNFARHYARILTRDGIELEVRNSAGAVEDLDLLRDAASGVQAALTTFGIAQPNDADTLYSLGGIFDAPIFIFYRDAEPTTRFAQFRGKRLSIGMPGTALRSLILQVLKATDAVDVSTHLLDLGTAEAVDALIAGEIDVAVFPSQLDGGLLQRALGAAGIRLMNVAQAEAIAKTIPGLKHVVLWRGLISLGRDIPNSDLDLLASRNRLLVRKDLHPALQYLLLEAMRKVHSTPGPFNRLGEFPAEQPNDLPLSPTAEAFYRSGPTFWQRYTSFWLASLLNRIVFFIIPVVATLIPVIGFAPRLYRWLYVRRIDRLHRLLGTLERELAQSAASSQLIEYETRIARIESTVQLLKVPRRFEVDLQRLRIHLRMVQEELDRMRAVH